MNQKICVTGATGFVGRYFCEYLLQHGYDVVGIGRQQALDIKHKNFQYNAFDLADLHENQSCLQGCHAIVHAAALAHQPPGQDPNRYYEINTDYTKQLLAICAAHKVKHFIYVSSIKAVGEQTFGGAFTEQTQSCPRDPYGRSKWLAEQYIQQISYPDMAWTIVRPPLIYGPGVKANLLGLIKWLDHHLPLPLGNINNRRSFLALDNLCSFLYTCLLHPQAKNQIFMVSDDDDQSTSDLIRCLKQIRGSHSYLLNLPLSYLKQLCWLGGKAQGFQRLTSSLTMDISKAKVLLNWQPEIDFQQAMAQYFSRPQHHC